MQKCPKRHVSEVANTEASPDVYIILYKLYIHIYINSRATVIHAHTSVTPIYSN